MIPADPAMRNAVVAEAKTWLGTPWHHRAAVRGAGCDCALFPLKVYQAVGLVEEGVEVADYPPDWALHRDEERYLAMVERFGAPIALEQAAAGDFIVWRYGRAFSHGGIVVAPGQVIHAYRKVGCVTIDDYRLEPELNTREARAFTFWGDSDAAA